jgi:hypothetical protein
MMSEETDASGARSLKEPPSLLRGSYSSGSPSHSRNESVRSKLSIPNPRSGRGGASTSAPGTPTDEHAHDVVQFQDMDFELVPPSSLQPSPSRASFDSMGGSREDDALGRAKSPSLTSPTAARGPSPTPTTSTHASRFEDAASIETHRQRELKWVAVLSTVPAAQMRKSKKVRRALLDGVPSSVRSVVWAALANISARRIEGVYAQLNTRGRVPATPEIERDLRACFSDRPVFADPAGPLNSLLQAYLTMVPDVRYHQGLALVGGYLLDQGPEEDAFWTFASVLDSHLRPYFSANPLQLEVDSALFSKALEVNDPALVKKLFVQLQLSPAAICKPWYARISSPWRWQLNVRQVHVHIRQGPAQRFHGSGLGYLSL